MYALIVVACLTCTTATVYEKFDSIEACVKARDELKKTVQAYLIECVKGSPGKDL